jgi:hypothetical protein
MRVVRIDLEDLDYFVRDLDFFIIEGFIFGNIDFYTEFYTIWFMEDWDLFSLRFYDCFWWDDGMLMVEWISAEMVDEWMVIFCG